MKFLIADNIPWASEVFSAHGQVERFSAREPTPRQLEDTTVLLIRSITQVDEALLKNAPALCFIGTATIGMEHVDQAALQARNIGFTSCPGVNADSVGEYVLTAVLALAEKQQVKLAGKRAAIVGAGNTGQASGRRLAALGLQVVYYDPPRAASEADFISADWDSVMSADIISLHVPLTRQGQHATHYLFGQSELNELKPQQWLINASRGAVINNQALLERQQKKPLTVTLDVWEGEPDVNQALIQHVDIATPHIAGHSINGKVKGTQMLYDACAQFFAWSAPAPDWAALFPAPSSLEWTVSRMPGQQRLAQWVLQNYPIWRDDQAMREHGMNAAGFDQLRHSYPARFELISQPLHGADNLNDSARQRLHQLGFAV